MPRKGGASKYLADAISEGLIVGPRLIQCGKALSQTGWWSSLTCESTLLVLDNISSMFIGGHADFGPSRSSTGCCAGHSQSLGRTCDGVPQVLKATREELKAGADFIKIMCGGGVASPTVRRSSCILLTVRSISWILRTQSRQCSSRQRRSRQSRQLVDRWVENRVWLRPKSHNEDSI